MNPNSTTVKKPKNKKLNERTTPQNPLFTNRALTALIFPLILEQALAITVGMADTMMISSVGEAAVSGVSLVDMLNMLIFTVLSALATGGCVVISQSLGAGRKDEALKGTKQLLFTVVVFSLLIAALVIILREGILRLFFGRIEADVMQAALIYLVISALSFPFLGVYNACAAMFRAMGKSNITFLVSVIGNLINVVGNAICIFGLHMGVAGVAIPTLISRVVMGMILYVLLRNPRRELYFSGERFRINKGIIQKILYIGIPGGIEGGIFQLGRVVVVSIISGFGTVQIAANGVANSLDAMGCIIGQAMNLAMVTVVGHCVGAGDEKQIRFYTKKLMAITYVATFLLNSTILIFLNPILSLYGLTAETTALAYTLVMIHNGIAIFLWPVSFVLPNMLRACNDVRYPMLISIFSMCAFRIGFSYVFGVWMGMGALGVWYAMVLDWIFRSICFGARYLLGHWKKYIIGV
ncbi:MAG: MATE family efflux transporter [Lachnospiraceae bacterium]|nr:MATE family efflux transporter [Lachnospiraceae bacterium]